MTVFDVLFRCHVLFLIMEETGATDWLDSNCC
jgi:hypothetical protein